MAEINGIPAPDTQPTSSIPNPIPNPIPSNPLSIYHDKSDPTEEEISRAAKSSRKSSKLPLPSSLTLRNTVQRTDALITHLSRILATPAGTDSLLMFLSYSSLAASSLLTSLSIKTIQARAQLLIQALVSLPPNTTVVLSKDPLGQPTSFILAKRLKALSSLISDFRIFARLWGLVGLWGWGKSVLLKLRERRTRRQKDAGAHEKGSGETVGKAELAIETAQLVACVLFQVLENGAYLSSKGVLGWDTNKQNRAWIWSSRFWAAHVGLEFLRLGREAIRRKGMGDGLHTGVKEKEDEERWGRWRREVVSNVAFAPLTLHWGTEGGLLGDAAVGVLGSVAAWVNVSNRWEAAKAA